MGTILPTDIDATFPDRDPGDAEHQRHHDAIHAYTNEHDTATDPHGDRAYADATFAKKSGDTFTGHLNRPARAGTVRRTTDQSIPAGATTTVVFDAQDSADGVTVNLATAPTRVTVSRSGLYLMVARTRWALNSTGERFAQIRPSVGTGAADRRSAVGNTEQAVFAVQRLAVGDYVELLVWQNSGVALSLTGGWPQLSLIYQGD